MPPAREVARTVADDRIGGERFAGKREAAREIERVAPGRRGGPFEPFAVRLGAGIEGDDFAFVPERGALGELAGIGADRQVGAVDAVELLRVRMDVD